MTILVPSSVLEGREPMQHELKTHPEPFEEMRAGRKRFEFRRRDRDFRVGDILHLREWDPATETYTNREDLYRVTYILADRFGLPPEFCIMSVSQHFHFEMKIFTEEGPKRY